MERGIVLLEAEMFRLQNSIIYKDTQIGDLEETKREMEAHCESHAEKNRSLVNELAETKNKMNTYERQISFFKQENNELKKKMEEERDVYRKIAQYEN